MRLQNYARMAFFLTTELWGGILADPPLPQFQVLSMLATHLYQLGLRYPSEVTMSMVFVLVNYKDAEMWKHNASCLYSEFSNVKSEFKLMLQRCKDLSNVVLGPYMLDLPNSFHELNASVQERVFASQPPADPGLSAEYLQHLHRKIPLRKTNRQVSSSMNAFQSQPDWMFALMNALEGNKKVQPKQSIVLANGETLPLVASEGAASATADLMIVAKDQAKQAQCIPSKTLLAPSESQSSESQSSQMPALPDLPPAAMPLALPPAPLAEDVVPKDTSTLQLSAEAPEPPATAQPSETIPVAAPAVKQSNSTFDKVMVQLKNSLEDRKNAKNQAEKAVLDGPKALAKAKAKAKTSKNSKGPKPKPASHKAVKPKPKAGKPKAVKTMADKPKASKPKAVLSREIPASLKRKFAEGCSRCRYRAGCTPSCWRNRGYQLLR